MLETFGRVLTAWSPGSFLLSTHYTRYDSHPALFTLNLLALLFVGLAPKLPAFHRLRIKFFDAGEGATPGACSHVASVPPLQCDAAAKP